MQKNTVKPRKFLAIFLALLMCFSLLPTMTFAASDDVTFENFSKVSSLTAGKYVIVSSGKALSSEANEGYTRTSGSSTYQYSGLSGKDVTVSGNKITSDVYADMVFTLEASSSKWIIKDASGNILNSTYGTSGNTTIGKLMLNSTSDTWSYSGNNLRSTNSTKYVQWDTSGSQHVFTVRSGGSDVDFYQVTDESAVKAVEHTEPTPTTNYKLVSSLTDGKEYIIANVNTGGGFALKNNSKDVDKISVSVKTGDVDGDGTADTYIASKDASVVMTAVADGDEFKLTNGEKSLYYSSGSSYNSGLRFSSSSSSPWTYENRQLKTDSNVFYYSSNQKKFSASSSSSHSDDKVYIYEKVTAEGEGGGQQQEEPTANNKTFTYASTVTEGKEYLLVSNGYALANASGTSVTAAKVTVNNNQIVLDANAAGYEEMLWTAGTSTSYTTQGTYTFQNGSDYFVRETNTNNAKTATTLNAYSVWTYDGSDLSQKNSSGQYTFYATYNNDFTVNVQQANSAELKLYVLDEGGTTPGGDGPTPPAPAGEVVYIGFTSDVHDNTTGLENWFKNLPDAIKLENMGYCGDYSYSYNDSYLNCFKTVVSLTNNYVGQNSGVYTTGNHCYQAGKYLDQMINTTGFVRLGEATNVTTNAYEVYGFGAYQGDGIGGFQQSDIDALDTYLNNHKSVPVFILSHYPLHYISSRTISKADDVIDVLNKYPNAVFVWGHNHSQGGESHYGEIKSFGDSIQYDRNSTSTIKEINFTYVCAGAGNNSQGLYDGCVAKVDGTEITFYYYDSTGDMATIKNRYVSSYTVDISDGSTTPGGDDPVTPPTPSGKTVSVEPTTSNPTGELTIAVGETGTITVVNGGSSQYTFSASVSGGSSYASVSPASQSIAQDGSATFTVTGLAAGTATITIQNNNSYGSQYTRKATITVNVTGEGGGDDPVVSGDQYLIIENGYALSSKTTGSYTTSGGSYSGYQGVKYTAGTTEVTADMLWNVEMNGNSYTISQNGQYLIGSYTSGSSATGTLTLGTTSATWTYSNNHLTIGSGNLTHSDGTSGVSGNPNVFSMRSSGNAGNVQIVKYEGGTTPADKTLTGISVKTAPTKTSYIAGQNFDSTGMVITATYDDGTTADKSSGWTITDGNNLTTGKTSVTISYTEGGVTKDTTQAITVAAKELSSISVRTAPTETSYIAGQDFDSTGMVIEKKYNDNSTDTATGWTVTDGTNLTEGKTSVTISYTEDGVTKTTTQAITVTEKAVSSIAVKTQPSKTVYNAGESFNAAGMVISVTYDDGSSEDVSTGFIVTPSGALMTSDTTVTISYGGKTATVNITVDQYSIDAPSNIQNGSVTVNTNSATVGSTVTITVTPDKGYKLNTLTVKDETGNLLTLTKVNDTTYTFMMPASKVMISATFVKDGTCALDDTCPAAKFTDLDLTAWYHDGVHFCVENGLIQGYPGNLFGPEDSLTRAQIVVILWRMEECPVTDYAMTFKDVKAEWYTEAIRWAQSTGIVAGYSTEAFGPDDPITREQMATILYRYAKYHDVDVANTNTLAGFDDLTDVSSWALDAMKWANAVGLVKGRTTTTLVPAAEIKRVEAAAMIQRYCENIK